jgi:tetratricopeptide (TPR) repeat protein
MDSCFFYSGRLLPRCVVLWLLTGLLGLGVSRAEENDLIDPTQLSVEAPEELSEGLILATPHLGANKSTDMTNSAIGRDPTDINVNDPVSYYANRVRAIELVKDQNWQEAKPLLQELTVEFQDDGDTWFLLGLTYLALEQWQEAIEALENTLALGTRLFGMPGGGANPNDMMIRLAEAYGQMGDEDRAIYWINQALEARWDDRPKLAGTFLFQQGKNPNFNAFEASEAFQRAAGSYLPNELSRDEGWRYDLHYLAGEIKRLHVHPYHATSAAAFEQKVNDINRRIPELSDKQVVFAFMQLLGTLGNGHNLIVPAFGEKGSFDQLPMQFYWFSDGLFVVSASEPYRQWIGHKVERVGDMSALKALELIKTINPRDNEMQQRWLAPYYFGLPSVLEGLGIVDKADAVILTLSDSRGARHLVRPEIKPMSFSGFPKLPGLGTADSPLYLRNNNDNYWFEQLPKQLLYVQFNDVANKESLSLKQFSKQIQQLIIGGEVADMALDLRHNSGGDGSLTAPVVATTVLFKALRPEGKLFVLIGRNTFSAAHNLVMSITELTDAVLVGEPSGSRPNALSEAGWFNLPYSKQTGLISSQFHQYGAPEDHRIWIAPHVPVGLSSEQYFIGEDPVMTAIIGISSQ